MVSIVTPFHFHTSANLAVMFMAALSHIRMLLLQILDDNFRGNIKTYVGWTFSFTQESQLSHEH